MLPHTTGLNLPGCIPCGREAVRQQPQQPTCQRATASHGQLHVS